MNTVSLSFNILSYVSYVLMSFISNQLPRRDQDDNTAVSFSENEEGARLGKLFFTIKYSFEKTALIVTVNKCSNLPAKDSANNSR